MIRLACDLHSECLGRAVSMMALIPQQPWPAGGRPAWPVLYLLHGLSDNHTIWLRRTALERYAEGGRIAIVMPDGGRSFYTDSAGLGPYWTFLSEELPARVQALLPVSAARADTYAAGLSMGGYGAFKLALRCPDRIAAAASLSGVLDLAGYVRSLPPERKAECRLLFGDPARIAGSDNDLIALAARLASSSGPKPRLYQCCGTGDFLYGANQAFLQAARGAGLAITYAEEPGTHDWAFWDRAIQRVLDWLAAKRLA